jgi:hypothetical protein
MHDYSGRSVNSVTAEPGFRDAVAQARLDAESAVTVGDYSRRLSGRSVAQVAKVIGVSENRTALLLKGAEVAQTSEAAALSKALHVPVDQLFDPATPEAKMKYRARF